MSVALMSKEALRARILRLIMRGQKRRRVSPSDIDYRRIRRILIVTAPGDMSDLLLALPAIRALWRQAPHGHVTVLSRCSNPAILEVQECVDEIMDFSNSGLRALVGKFYSMLQLLCARYDLTILMPGRGRSWLSDFLALLSGARFIVGESNPRAATGVRNLVYTINVPQPQETQHAMERNFDLLRHIGVHSVEYGNHLKLTDDEVNEAIEYLLQNGVKYKDFILALDLTADPNIGSWEIHKYVEVARHFSAKHEAHILTFWDIDSRERGEQFVSGLPFKAISANQMNLRMQAALLSCCNVFVCCDLNLMHLAACLGVPLVGLFEKRDPHTCKPIGNRFAAIKCASLKCQDIDAFRVITTAESLVELYPKSVEGNGREFDISEQVVDDYLGFGDINENYL